jgi:hypothetical protein
VAFQPVLDGQLKPLQFLDPEYIRPAPRSFHAQFAVDLLVILHQAKRRKRHKIILIEHSLSSIGCSGQSHAHSGVFKNRLTTAPETSDAADITFLPKKQASEGPGPLNSYGAILSELQA